MHASVYTYAYKASDGSGFGDMQFATDYNNGITYAMNALSIGVGSGRVGSPTQRVGSCRVNSGTAVLPLFSSEHALKSGTFGVPGLVPLGRGTTWYKSGTSREIRDGRQAYWCVQRRLLNEPTRLSGSRTSRSRFGFALSPAGDLNLDGFNGICRPLFLLCPLSQGGIKRCRDPSLRLSVCLSVGLSHLA